MSITHSLSAVAQYCQFSQTAHHHRWVRPTLIIISGLLLLFISLYAAIIWVEKQVLTTAHETLSINEDNQDRQMTLDQLRSYEKIAQVSAQNEKLVIAKEVIEVATRPQPTKLSQPWTDPPVTGAYGY